MNALGQSASWSYIYGGHWNSIEQTFMLENDIPENLI